MFFFVNNLRFGGQYRLKKNKKKTFLYIEIKQTFETFDNPNKFENYTHESI